MNTYEELIEIVEDLQEGFSNHDEGAVAALEYAIEAMTFVNALYSSLKENGANLKDPIDTDEVGVVLDGVFAELSAASLFLSEPSFARVPEMLRTIADGIVKMSDTLDDVPSAIVAGFKNFAKRIEATRVQKKHLIDTLKQVDV